MRDFSQKRAFMLWVSYGYVMGILWCWFEIESKSARCWFEGYGLGVRGNGLWETGNGKKERTEIHKEQKGKNTNKKKRLLLPSR